MEDNPAAKLKRQYFRTYLQMVRNSVDTEMFRNFYIHTADGIELDSVADGEDSCAFYVSSVLTIFQKAARIHGTVQATLEDMQQAGWHEVALADMAAGDVLVWEAVQSGGMLHEHIGFYVGEGRAISNSSAAKKVAEHDAGYDGTRAIIQVLRHDSWM
jgi:hypothetical protein